MPPFRAAFCLRSFGAPSAMGPRRSALRRTSVLLTGHFELSGARPGGAGFGGMLQERASGKNALYFLSLYLGAGSIRRYRAGATLLFNRVPTSSRTPYDTGFPSLEGRNISALFDCSSALDTAVRCWTSYTKCAARNGAGS